MNEKEYLPIGTVVKLKNGNHELMIMGYLPKSDNEIYDYVSCLFPEGILSLTDLLVFNQEQIETINFNGYKFDNYNQFNKLLNQINLK